jgi:N-acylneuraminate cytidylyltransferase
MIALIPARGGSERIPRKNIRLLAGHPLLAYTIGAAQDAGCFDRILVSTEDQEIAGVAFDYGAEVIPRPPELARADSPDVDWVRHALDWLHNPPMVTWAILRPTSPFRTAATIRRAYRAFHVPDGTHDSLRAVQPVSEHPGKMWTWAGEGHPITPLLKEKRADGTPWHSSPTQSLPRYYVQNACLEMGWGGNIWARGTIHGSKVLPFFTEGYEGIDCNTERDWREVEALLATGAAQLPPVALAPVSADLWAV